MTTSSNDTRSSLEILDAVRRRRFISVERAGGCTNPIRLSGSIMVRDDNTGTPLHSWDSERDELNGAVYVPCKTRRADKCESCSRLYQGDAYRLIVDGLRGGESVPQDVKEHPALFLTFTAPSFGVVHRHAMKADETILACHPRRGGEICPHGQNLDCKKKHTRDDPAVGQAMCPDCYDYDRAATWNHFAGKLWRQTRIEIEKQLAKKLGTKRVEMRRDIARTEFVKIAEFQARGMVHFHVAIRLDGPDGNKATADLEGPDGKKATTTDLEVLTEAVRKAHERTSVATVEDQRIGWGNQLDIKVIGAHIERGKLAGYFAKYATKSADAKGQLNQRIRDEHHLEYLPVNDHLARMVRAARKRSRGIDRCEVGTPVWFRWALPHQVEKCSHERRNNLAWLVDHVQGPETTTSRPQH